MIDLRIAEQQDKLKMTCTAEEAGLKEGTSVIVSRVETEEESSDTIERMIVVKVQKPGISKPWTKSILRTASTIHLYHNFVTDNQLKHGQYIIYRSDGSRISRYTTMEHLNLRKDEVLIARQIDPILIDTFWLDARKQQQNKSTFVDKNTKIAELRDILREDLFIDFECIVRIQGPEADSDTAIGTLPNLAGKLSVSLCRIGQENWNNPAFENTLIDKEIMAIVRTGDSGATTFTMSAIDDATIMDFLHTIYTADATTRYRVLEDHLGLPYQLTDKLVDIVPASGTLSAHLNTIQEYTVEQINTALQTIAIQRQTTSETLVAHSLTSFMQW